MTDRTTRDQLERNKQAAGEFHRELEPEFILAEDDLVTTCYYVPQPEPENLAASYDCYAFDTYRFQDGQVVEHWSSDNKIAPLTWQRARPKAHQLIDPGPPVSKEQIEANKRLVIDSYRYVFDAENPAAIKDFFAEDYQHHYPQFPPGRTGFDMFVNMLFPDGPRPVQPELLRPPTILMAEGDMLIYVADRPQPELDDPTSKFTFLIYNAFKIRDGMLAEHWSGVNMAAPPNLD
ncbi:hypothetical protein OG226_41570 [Streptomyces sp. NBC_01261]|uniref:hypothetical protein n=1 Tax=Streptomyces sp. NBC_01261 TaxID=2903802 RepID=UPI002E2ED2B3|nr:hypothetical protein [Streptomyces sp. NBC_01261]